MLSLSVNNNEQNTLTAVVTGKRNREVGLVVPGKLFFQTKDRKSAETLKIELAKRKNLFPTKTLKFWEKRNIENSRFIQQSIATKRKYKIELETYCSFLLFFLVY